MALERRIEYVVNLDESDEFTRTDLVAGEGFVSYYGVPLIAQGEVRGVLDIFHRALLAPEPEWLNFLESVALQTAIAIDHANLFTKTRHLLQQTQEQAQQLDQVMETVPEGVLLLSGNYHVALANPIARAHLAVLAEPDGYALSGEPLVRLGGRPLGRNSGVGKTKGGRLPDAVVAGIGGSGLATDL